MVGETLLTAPALALLLDILALADLESALAALLVVDRAGSHAVLDLLGHGQESLLDIRGRLGRCL